MAQCFGISVPYMLALITHILLVSTLLMAGCIQAVRFALPPALIEDKPWSELRVSAPPEREPPILGPITM